MPVSNHPSFEVKIRNPDKTITMVPDQTVHVYDVTNAVLLDDLASDANGIVAAGTLPVAAGTLVRFAFFRAADLECGKVEKITT
jgi:hypothetical protein